jgi:hypothetical protein
LKIEFKSIYKLSLYTIFYNYTKGNRITYICMLEKCHLYKITYHTDSKEDIILYLIKNKQIEILKEYLLENPLNTLDNDLYRNILLTTFKLKDDNFTQRILKELLTSN